MIVRHRPTDRGVASAAHRSLVHRVPPHYERIIYSRIAVYMMQYRISAPRTRISSARGALRGPARIVRQVVRAQKSDQETSKPGQRSTYRPDSYTEIVNDATTAIVSALEAGEGRMEVEFPSVANVSGYAGSSDRFIDSSIQLSISMARKLRATTGKLVHIVLPDGPEYNRAYKLFRSALEASEGVTLGHLREKQKNSFMDALAVSFSMTGETPPDSSEFAENAEVFVAVNASTVELPELERYALETVKDRKLITWNMELDNLRADLGLLGFPPKDLQYRFLSTIKPVFYIRQRDYSKTVSVSPFIINYSGALFREYPGPWQAMLRQDNGTYACVAESAERYALGAFKLELSKAMGLDVEEEGSTIQFLRTGRRASTWWEDEEEGGKKEESRSWRS